MQALSLVIITFNEAGNIADCIRSVQGLANEVLVLDSFSTDNTREIAESMGARVLTHTFDGHIQQKNRAKNMAQHDWVLSLDADERLSEKLKKSIADALQNPQFPGYRMNRLNHYSGKPIKTCGWYPDTKLRLWQKSCGEWTGTNPHDRFELYNGNSGFLNGDILHFTYASKEAMLKQVNKFAHISAEQNKDKSTIYLNYKMLLSSTFKFIKTYVFQLGFTDGKFGWDVCFQQSREVYLKYKFALELKRKNAN